MPVSLIQENTEEKTIIGSKLRESHIYWGNYRIIFNVLVGLTGLVCVGRFGAFMITSFDIFGMIAWGVVANALYSFGYVLDSTIIVRSKGIRSLAPYRQFLFWTGTIAYMLVSIAFSMNYFFLSPD